MSVNNTINPNFDMERFWFVTKRLVEVSDVPFIFVDAPIKAAICKYTKSIHEYSDRLDTVAFRTLLAMRPAKEFGHRNHFHVREQCAPWMYLCQTAQAPSPNEGTGCPSSS